MEDVASPNLGVISLGPKSACKRAILRRSAKGESVMLFKVIEWFRGHDPAPIYARPGFADGTERRVKVALRKGDLARLVDWEATRELWE